MVLHTIYGGAGKKAALFLLCFVLFPVFFPGLLGGQSLEAAVPGAEAVPERRIFPSLYFRDFYRASEEREAGRPYWAATETELSLLARRIEEEKPLLLNQDILAFYGHPLSRRMGILGRYSLEELDRRLSDLAGEYREVNNGRGVKKAFYIIYGTVWPEGQIGILQDSVLQNYIQYALDHDILIFLDHQIGRYDVVESLKKMFPYLRYPNVHLALDPEWRTERPMEEIGSVSAAEINEAQQVMEEYLREHKIPGERMLVIHQFNWRMIRNREQVRSDFEKVRLVHCADGFGSPSMKRSSYAYNARAANIPVKGFKLFYNLGIPGAGYDDPLLEPRDVLSLDPRPYIIMYQ
ncbi:MAG: hypothetical protein LBH73_04675 [Spirochaetaceae bacterium]|jgi:hypothetical protein|nr:hypothetical protein [Spirochaetaceae bacterium]